MRAKQICLNIANAFHVSNPFTFFTSSIFEVMLTPFETCLCASKTYMGSMHEPTNISRRYAVKLWVRAAQQILVCFAYRQRDALTRH